MFDFRYHALSLAAVFIALVVGLLLGVAIGDKELVSSAQRDLRSSLRADVRQADQERDEAKARLREQEQFADAAYPILTQEPAARPAHRPRRARRRRRRAGPRSAARCSRRAPICRSSPSCARTPS